MIPAPSASRQRLRPLALLLLVVGAGAITACRADFDVTITVEEDGSGIVETVTTLDAEASDALLDLELDADGLPLSDLAQSGWVVSPPEREADGTTVVTASKEFGTTSQFSEVMSELTGEDGALRNFRLFRTKTFARVEYSIVGTVNTTDGLDSFSDDELVQALGRPVSQIAEGYGASADDVTLTVDVVLPGGVQGEAPLEVIETEASETRAAWEVPLSRRDVTSIELTSATREVAPLVLRGVAIVAAVLAGLVVFAQLLRIVFPDRRRRTSRRPTRRHTTDRPAPKEPVLAETDSDDASEPATDSGADVVEPHRVVALDGLGVLYRRGGTVSTVLIPFARERASRLADEDIEAKARLLELGRITTG
ncbi:MAG: hypothetical protein OEV40_24735, partial [Acidimicrobiia bacterium]|nr:hypothetical protein [Acidimicrobiia bacterium]